MAWKWKECVTLWWRGNGLRPKSYKVEDSMCARETDLEALVSARWEECCEQTPFTEDGRRRIRSLEKRRKNIDASIEYAAPFHVQVEEWSDRDEMVPKARDSLQFVQRQTEGCKHWSEQCGELGGRYTCMRCGQRSEQAGGWGKSSMRKIEKEPTNTLDVHELQRMVGMRGKMRVWCRKCSG